jgi:hypothetical protein
MSFEGMLDLELLDSLTLRQDLRKQLAQARDVPLVVAELVDHAPFGLGGSDLEGLVEGRVGGLDPEVSVQDEERLADRLDDAFGEDSGFLPVLRDRGLVGHRLCTSLSPMLRAYHERLEGPNGRACRPPSAPRGQALPSPRQVLSSTIGICCQLCSL